MADEMQPLYTSEPDRVPAVGDEGEFQTFKEPSVYVPYVQYDSIERLAVYGSVEGVSSIYVNSHQHVLPIPKPLTLGDVWHSKVKSSYDKRIVLDGSSDEVFIQTNNRDGWIQIATQSDAVIPESISVVGSIKSSYLKAYAIEEVYSKQYSGISVDSSRRIRLSFKSSEYPNVTSVETARTYLSAHPLTIYYRSISYNGTNGLKVSIADYKDEIYANNPVDIFTDDGELRVDGGGFAEVAVSNIVLNGKTNDERAGEYGTPQVHTFP